jgi:hypothetical protein
MTMKHAAKLQRPHKLGAIHVYVANQLAQISSEAWIKKGPDFATLYLTRDARSDVLLTAAQGAKLDDDGEVEASYKGQTGRFVVVDRPY